MSLIIDTVGNLMGNKAFLFAHFGEAKELIVRTNAEKIENKPFQISKFYNGLIVISGEGYSNALACVVYLQCKYNIDTIVNAGFAGSLIDSIKLGEIYQLKRIVNLVQYDEEKQPSYYNLKPILELPKASVVTCSAPVKNNEKRRDLSKFADLADMEAAAYAFLNKKLNYNLICVKIVSDADDDISTAFTRKNEFSVKLSNFIIENLKVFK